MPTTNPPLKLPNYDAFMESIAPLALPISGSELHGIMCGYLCADAAADGVRYLRALLSGYKDQGIREATLVLFAVYTVTQQQMDRFDFDFQLLVPEDNMPLLERARAFSEWCEGFTQGINMAGVRYDQLEEEEAQEALHHMTEFAQLDLYSLKVDEEDEQALMQIYEHARMAVLRIHADLHDKGQSEMSH